jgi:hypothetical protein
MNLSAEQRAMMLATTKGAAGALMEDLAHLREIAGKAEHSPAELRRSSAVLRRLVVENDLRAVAAPRIGRFRLRIPDYSHFYRSERLTPIDFFGSAGETTLTMYPAVTAAVARQLEADSPPPGAHRIALAHLDGFRDQRVMCLRGAWCSRGAIIKFVANTASGVHTEKGPGNAEEHLIRELRRTLKFTRAADGSTNVTLLYDGEKPIGTEGPYDGVSIDPVLSELLSAMKLITESEDVIRLEHLIRAELAAHSA